MTGSRKEELVNFFAMHLWRSVLNIILEAGRGLAFCVICLTLLQAVLGLAVIWFIKFLVETLSQQGITEQAGWQLALIIGTIVFSSLASVLASYLGVKQSIFVAELVNRRIHTTAATIDYGFYESPAYFDTLERARQAGSQRPAQLITNGLMFIKSSAFLLGSVILLALLDWRILPAIFVSLLIVLLVRLKYTKAQYNWQRKRIQLERKASYIDTLITNEFHAKELRLASLGMPLIKDYQQTKSVINDGQVSIERQKAVAEFLVSLLGAAIFATATTILIFKDASSSEAVGNIVLFLLLFRRAEISGREMVQSVSKLYDDKLYLQQLFDFLQLEEQTSSSIGFLPVPSEISKGMSVKNVSFTYSSNIEPTLTDINMELPAGKVVALVGENGSGKTTLIKLLTRLYEPQSGVISIDGTNANKFKLQDYREIFSVVFQSFASYAMTLRQNVSAGDIANMMDDERIYDALHRGGAMDVLKKMPEGLDTPLTRMFESGQELSLGQWQRIALSRAFFRNSHFLVLDEPSSALDARAESELFENLKSRAGGRTVLLISHRLSTVSLADYTYVLEKGRIVEEGTHDELVKAGGQYSELFEIQARRYN